MRTRGTRRRPGFTLMELSVVMAALAIATGLLATAVWGAIRLEKASAGAFDQASARHALADQFRADVAAAADAPARWRDHTAGRTCLVLRLTDGRHVVYRWEDDRLLRTESAGKATHRRHVPAGGQPAAVEFARSGPGGRLVTLRLFSLRRDGGQVPSAEISAALGGDLQ